MAAGPCLNPSCHSHGQPLPNCRCYMAGRGAPCQCHLYANGGDAYSPTAQERLDKEPATRGAAQSGHVGEPGMAHYAEGGPSDADFSPAAPTPNDSEFSPVLEETSINQPSDSDFTPTADPSETYRTPGQQVGAELEGFAQG